MYLQIRGWWHRRRRLTMLTFVTEDFWIFSSILRSALNHSRPNLAPRRCISVFAQRLSPSLKFKRHISKLDYFSAVKTLWRTCSTTYFLLFLSPSLSFLLRSRWRRQRWPNRVTNHGNIHCYYNLHLKGKYGGWLAGRQGREDILATVTNKFVIYVYIILHGGCCRRRRRCCHTYSVS